MFMTSNQLAALLKRRQRKEKPAPEGWHYTDAEQKEWEDWCNEQEKENG